MYLLRKFRSLIQLSYPKQIIIAVTLGCAAGLFIPEYTQPFGQLGGILIKGLKFLAPPLLFFAIVDAFFHADIKLKSGFQLLAVSGTNAIVACIIALGASALFWEIGPDLSHLTDLALSSQHQKSEILDQLPTGMSAFKNPIFLLLGLGILTGITLKQIKQSSRLSVRIQAQKAEKAIQAGLKLISTVLHLVIRWIPLAVFGVVSHLVSQSGFEVFSSLAWFVILVASAIFVHTVVYYSFLLFFVVRTSPIDFFRRGKAALSTAFGTGSSLATLPVTLETLQNEMLVSQESSRLAACIGTNLNHAGILLYEAVTALFLANVYGLDLTFSQQLIVLGTSAIAAVGIGGIPDAGLITLSLVLTSVGLPLELIPVLLTVDWLVGRLRATSNVTSDMVVANVLERFKQKEYTAIESYAA